MRAFLRERFPSLDADDIIQETFIALARAIPRYVYNPQENGHFHNYLTGILRNKALKALAARNRDAIIKKRVASARDVSSRTGSPIPSEGCSVDADDERQWRESVYEIALQQLLADEAIHERTKQVFIRLVIKGEKPARVAESLGIPRKTVDRLKERTLDRLRKYVRALKDV